MDKLGLVNFNHKGKIMKYEKTQSLLTCQKNGIGNPDFLKVAGDYIQIYVSETPLSFIVADGDSHYLIEERAGIQRAWGPFYDTVGITYNLYVDVNPVSAVVSRSYTSSEVVYSTDEPDHVNGIHWYDENTHKMFVSADDTWVPVIRFFVGTFSNGALITYNKYFDSIENNAGFIVYDYDNKGVRKSNGKFLTTQDSTRLNTGTFSNAINPEDREYVASPTEQIPAFTFVAVSGDNKISIANSSNINKLPIGMVLEAVSVGDTVNVHTEGIVINPQWNFDSSQIGKFVYCDVNGEITFEKVMVGNYTVRVGKVLSANSINIKMDIVESVINGDVIIGGGGGSGDKEVIFVTAKYVNGAFQTFEEAVEDQKLTLTEGALYVLLQGEKTSTPLDYFVNFIPDFPTHAVSMDVDKVNNPVGFYAADINSQTGLEFNSNIITVNSDSQQGSVCITCPSKVDDSDYTIQCVFDVMRSEIAHYSGADMNLFSLLHKTVNSAVEVDLYVQQSAYDACYYIRSPKDSGMYMNLSFAQYLPYLPYDSENQSDYSVRFKIIITKNSTGIKAWLVHIDMNTQKKTIIDNAGYSSIDFNTGGTLQSVVLGSYAFIQTALPDLVVNQDSPWLGVWDKNTYGNVGGTDSTPTSSSGKFRIYSYVMTLNNKYPSGYTLDSDIRADEDFNVDGYSDDIYYD
jgi:hypothetical protein